ncbi:MBL fold metallo-hydrolase [Candidatus Pacebacteria bacterium]|nr:MBL fold metallo-hydrolase [Candidatus Paceibacterota bacterium]
MGLSIIQVAVGGFDNNFSYIVFDEETRTALIVDPSGNLDLILETVDDNSLNIAGALVTHTHHDHIDKLDELLRSYRIPVHVHEKGISEIVSPTPIFPMRDKETLILGAHQLTVMHTPGHIDDAVCFCIDKNNAEDGMPKVITGDTLFVEGCGRTNTYGVRALYKSLQRLAVLPDSTVVYPGHNYGSKPHSTIAWEKKSNKYFLVEDFIEFKKLRLG